MEKKTMKKAKEAPPRQERNQGLKIIFIRQELIWYTMSNMVILVAPLYQKSKPTPAPRVKDVFIHIQLLVDV